MSSFSATSPLAIVSLALFTAALFVAFQRSQRTLNAPHAARRLKSTRTVVLTGPMAAGKTALFSKLLYGHAPVTHTSMKENEGLIKQKWVPAAVGEQAELSLEKATPPAKLEAVPLSKAVSLVDTPGHARLRARALAQFAPAADGIVFVIDAAQGFSGPRVREAGEHLHILLSLLNLIPTPPPLLILLTKSDLLPTTASSTPAATQAKALERAKLSLSRELERRRATSTSTNAGARLEGLEAPVSGASTSSSVFKSLWEAVLGGGGSAGVVERAAVSLPSDEAEILAGEAFPFEGSFGWDKLGLEIEWATGGVRDGGSVAGLWEFMERLR